MIDIQRFAGPRLRQQAGLVTRPQLLGAGLTRRQVAGLVERGRLERMSSGIYRVPGTRTEPLESAWHVVLAVGGRLTGAHLISALGLEGGGYEGAPEIVLARRSPPTGLACTIVPGAIPGSQRQKVGAIPAVRPELAIIHLAGWAHANRVRQAVDSGRWTGALRLGRLLPLAHDLDPLPGARKVLIMQELELFDDESEGERGMGACLGTLAMLFRRQADDVVPGRRFDRYCDLARLALEYDGRVGQRDLDRDALKDLESASAEVLVVHVTSGMLGPGRRAATARMIADLVTRRAAMLAAMPPR